MDGFLFKLPGLCVPVRVRVRSERHDVQCLTISNTHVAWGRTQMQTQDRAMNEQNPFTGASRGKNTKSSVWRKERRIRQNSSKPLYGGSSTGSGLWMLHRERDALGAGNKQNSSQKHRRSFSMGRTVPLGTLGTNGMIQHRGFVRNLPKKAPDNGTGVR